MLERGLIDPIFFHFFYHLCICVLQELQLNWALRERNFRQFTVSKRNYSKQKCWLWQHFFLFYSDIFRLFIYLCIYFFYWRKTEKNLTFFLLFIVFTGDYFSVLINGLSSCYFALFLPVLYFIWFFFISFFFYWLFAIVFFHLLFVQFFIFVFVLFFSAYTFFADTCIASAWSVASARFGVKKICMFFFVCGLSFLEQEKKKRKL